MCSCICPVGEGYAQRSLRDMGCNPTMNHEAPYCPEMHTRAILKQPLGNNSSAVPQPLSALESARTRKGCEFRPEDLVLQPLVVSFSVLMRHELRGRPMAARFPDQNHPV